MSESLKEKLMKKRQKLKEKSSGGNVVFLKEGTTRIRILPNVEPDGDFSVDAVHFYLGNEVKGVFSAATFGKPCPIMEFYQGAKTKDKSLAKSMAPRTRPLVCAIIYESENGKDIDEERSGKLIMLPTSILASIIDMYLDPELGDFTDFEEGYDLKIRRQGSGKLDTTYSVTPTRPSPVPKKWAKPVNLRELVGEAILPYEEAENKLAEFLALTDEGDESRGVIRGDE